MLRPLTVLGLAAVLAAPVLAEKDGWKAKVMAQGGYGAMGPAQPND